MQTLLSKVLFAWLFAWSITGCGDNHPSPQPVLSAELTRTSYGVVHIRAKDFAGLGFGLAYAYAQDNVCMLADSFLTVRGERSRYFGGAALPTGGDGGNDGGNYSVAIDYLDQRLFDLRNEDSDFFFKAYLDVARLRAGYAAGSAEATALLSGYVAGYNRYLREHRHALPAACRGAPWVVPITLDDMLLLVAEKALHASGELFANEILAAARGEGDSTAAPLPPTRDWTHDGLGSNAVAIGGAVSVDGRGLLLANPHYPWFSTDRFYQVHLTIPGVYDAMGAALGGIPIVVIGFNKDVAWTHTVTKAAHFTTFRLALDQADPSGATYLVDGAPQRMIERMVEVQLLQPDGSLRAKRKVFRETAFGMTMIVPGLPIDAGGVLVLGDPNRYNTRLLDQWIALGQADSVPSLQAALGRVMGLPWVNTVAADRHGATLYADYSVVPHMATEKFVSGCLLFAPLLTFDGSRSACHWGSDAGAPAGIFGAAHAPALSRDDYVANSNDSYWLANGRQLLVGPPPWGYSPLYGPVAVPQHLRTRVGFVQLEERLAQGARVGLDDLQQLLFSNRVHAAELVLPDLLAGCRASDAPALAAACAVLAAWDRKVELDSRGALLFRTFWLRAANLPDIWAIPFDSADPVHTPRGVAPAAVAPLLSALQAAATELSALGIPLDAALGDYQAESRNGTRTPVHGGIGDVDGVYNAVHMRGELTAGGYEGVAWGASYLQLTGFDGAGPVARGLLVYGQSTDPASPYFADQLPLYSARILPALPFTAEQIRADENHRSMTIMDR